jgi:hypothetical protein
VGALETSFRAIRQNPVGIVGADGVERPGFMKILPIELAVARRSTKYNRIGLFLPDGGVQEGDLVRQAGETYIVGNLSPDVYRGRVIRLAAEMVWCSHLGVEAYRPTLTRHPSSGVIIGSDAQLVASGISLLLITSDISVASSREVAMGQWNAYVSRHATTLQSEDYLLLNGTQYEVKYSQTDIQGIRTYRVMRATR